MQELKYNPFDYKSLSYGEMLTALDANPLFANRPEWLKILLAGRQDIIASYIDARANDLFLPTAYTKKNVFGIAALLDYHPTFITCASGVLKVTLKADTPLPCTIPKANLRFATSVDVGGDKVLFQAKSDITFTQLETFIDIYEGFEVIEEDVYMTAGAEFETFRLRRNGAVRGSISLLINNEIWNEVESLLDSGPTARHFRTYYGVGNEVYVRFGNGVNGRLAPVGHFPTVTAWFGGGVRGNVRPGYIDKYIGTSAYIQEVTNTTAFTGGRNEESLDSVKLHAPMYVQAQQRCVSASDFRVYTESFYGIYRARIVPNAYGLLTVKVQAIPAGGGIPGDALRSEIGSALKDKTLLSNMFIQVDPVDYSPVNVILSLKLKSGYLIENVRPLAELGVKLFVGETSFEFKELMKTKSIEEVIDYINMLFGYTFDVNSKIIQQQIRLLIDKAPVFDWGEPVHEYIFHEIPKCLEGIDYLEVVSGSLATDSGYMPTIGLIEIDSLSEGKTYCSVSIGFGSSATASVVASAKAEPVFSVNTSAEPEVN